MEYKCASAIYCGMNAQIRPLQCSETHLIDYDSERAILDAGEHLLLPNWHWYVNLTTDHFCFLIKVTLKWKN